MRCVKNEHTDVYDMCELFPLSIRPPVPNDGPNPPTEILSRGLLFAASHLSSPDLQSPHQATDHRSLTVTRYSVRMASNRRHTITCGSLKQIKPLTVTHYPLRMASNKWHTLTCDSLKQIKPLTVTHYPLRMASDRWHTLTCDSLRQIM